MKPLKMYYIVTTFHISLLIVIFPLRVSLYLSPVSRAPYIFHAPATQATNPPPSHGKWLNIINTTS